MKFTNITKLIAILIITTVLFIGYSCNATKKTTDNNTDDLGSLKIEKSGATLWGENCGNCHNAPDPTAFTDKQWETIKLHMHMRAGLTDNEVNKIVAFLQQSN